MRRLTSRSAAWNFSSKDYHVRILGNALILGIESNRELGTQFFHRLVDLFLSKTFVATYENTANFFVLVRLWNSIHLLIPHISPEQAVVIAEKFVNCIKLENIASVRNYIEWALMRLCIMHPQCSSVLWRCFLLSQQGARPRKRKGALYLFFDIRRNTCCTKYFPKSASTFHGIF